MKDQFLLSGVVQRGKRLRRATGGHYFKLQLSNGFWMYATPRQLAELNITDNNLVNKPLIAACTKKRALDRNYYIVSSIYRLDDLAGEYRVVLDQIVENAKRLDARYQQLSATDQALLYKALETTAYTAGSLGSAMAAVTLAPVAWPWALTFGAGSILSAGLQLPAALQKHKICLHSWKHTSTATVH